MKLTPQELLAHCQKNGITIERIHVEGGSLITLRKDFEAGNLKAYSDAESDVSIIYSIPMTSAGSTWGTSGDGIGGYSAVKNGCHRMSRSGVSKKFLKELKKVIEAEVKGL